MKKTAWKPTPPPAPARHTCKLRESKILRTHCFGGEFFIYTYVMHIEFSPHAELKVNQRKLSREKVVETVLHPDFSEVGYRKRTSLFKDFGKNLMKVVVVRHRGGVVVVTAHWIAKKPKKQ